MFINDKSAYCTPETVSIEMDAENTLCQSPGQSTGGNDDIVFDDIIW